LKNPSRSIFSIRIENIEFSILIPQYTVYT
jgi:hypothetical protein